ncbi:MAG: phosphoglycerate dehydrogenase [Alphaproteobacteria bacterium]|nr:phosphoglycerate dehydrogenase [Alphaproteobacteria bacterium]
MEALVEELGAAYPGCKINTEGERYYLSEQRVIEYLDGFDAAIVSFESINERVLSALPDLKVVSKLGVGLDKIDPAAMKAHGVRLGWRAGVNKRSVAELALALMLMCLRHVVPLNIAMRAGERPLPTLGRELSACTVGLHGCGNIGKEVARLLGPFGCSVLACDIADYADFYAIHGIEAVEMDEMLARADVVSLHLTVTEKTRGLYGAAVLDRMKPGSVLINTARGALVDQDALKARLMSGRIGAAGLDVFAVEPPDDPELLNLPSLVATPHSGACTVDARLAMGRTPCGD